MTSSPDSQIGHSGNTIFPTEVGIAFLFQVLLQKKKKQKKKKKKNQKTANTHNLIPTVTCNLIV
jgi:hypothetical protein